MSEEWKNVTLKRSLKNELEKMRSLAKKGFDTRNEAKAFWVGFDQACFNLQQRFNYNETSHKNKS